MDKAVYEASDSVFIASKIKDCRLLGKNHKLILTDKREVVFIRNRSLKGKDFLLRRRYSCVLRKNKYYLVRYSVYKCTECGKEVYVKKSSKRISKEDAVKSGLRIQPCFTLPKNLI